MWGEHDQSGVAGFSKVLAAAVDSGAVDVVVGVGGVSFMDASTLGSFVRGNVRLAGLSRRLTLRSLSDFQRKLFDVCGLQGLIDVSSVQDPPARSAVPLETWVALPVMSRESQGSPRTGGESIEVAWNSRAGERRSECGGRVDRRASVVRARSARWRRRSRR